MAYDEPEDWKLYDLTFRATKQQSNAMFLEWSAPTRGVPTRSSTTSSGSVAGG